MLGRIAPKLPGWNAHLGAAPSYEAQVATTNQTVFNTAIPTVANSTAAPFYTYLTIFVNGVYQEEGATKSYTVTGPQQVTFNNGLSLNSDVVFIAFA